MNEIELNYGAISIDNTALKEEGYRFSEGLLAQMRQFKDSPVKVIQTDIVHNEAIKHISLEITKTRSSINQSLRSAQKQLKIKLDRIEEARALLSIEGNDKEVAENRLNIFYASIGGEKLSSSKHVDLSILMDMYFETTPPFETGKDKKNEFPDAISLLCLDSWAEENDTDLVVVSKDKGWKEYANSSSDRITVISSLAEALEKFQPHNKVTSIINHIREDSLLDEENHILKEIELAIDRSVDGWNIDIEACSAFYYEYDDVSACYVDHQLDVDQKGLVKITVIRIDDESIVLKVSAEVEVEVEACFDFSVHDSIDKDYVGIGSNVCSSTETYHTDILITLTGDFSQAFDAIEVENIEVLETISHADFGEVEPDWGDEDEP